ncbi:MAG: RNase H family protein, partial [Devosia sp.]
MTVVIHTDGACSGNPGPGGWGAVLAYGETIKELKGVFGTGHGLGRAVQGAQPGVGGLAQRRQRGRRGR